MRRVILLPVILVFSAKILVRAQKPGGPKFIWGVASASYQMVEDAYQADGKGLSNWDAYTNQYHVYPDDDRRRCSVTTGGSVLYM